MTPGGIVGIHRELGWFSTKLACEKAYLDPSKVILYKHLQQAKFS